MNIEKFKNRNIKYSPAVMSMKFKNVRTDTVVVTIIGPKKNNGK